MTMPKGYYEVEWGDLTDGDSVYIAGQGSNGPKAYGPYKVASTSLHALCETYDPHQVFNLSPNERLCKLGVAPASVMPVTGPAQIGSGGLSGGAMATAKARPSSAEYVWEALYQSFVAMIIADTANSDPADKQRGEALKRRAIDELRKLGCA